jgi:hypothetical protein
MALILNLLKPTSYVMHQQCLLRGTNWVLTKAVCASYLINYDSEQ